MQDHISDSVAVNGTCCLYEFAGNELGQGEFGSVLKAMWKAPSGNKVVITYRAIGYMDSIHINRQQSHKIQPYDKESLYREP